MQRWVFKAQKDEVFVFNEDKFREVLLSLPKGPYWLKIERITAKRSLPQNNYYWGVVLPTIADHTGHTPEELHEIYKRMFLPPQFVQYRGKEIKMPHTTTKLNKLDFGDYLERIFAEAGAMGITIEPPNIDNPY